MKVLLRLATTVGISVLPTMPIGALAPAMTAVAATTFGQQEVPQEKLIVLAAPLGQSAHKLLILEQLSDRRPCWRVNRDTYQTVEPLLLKFNFTNICGRSTDSNSFSIRMAGQDLGLKYSLRLVYRNNVAVLIGTPINRSLPEIEIGRTKGITPNFMRIDLNPDWRLTKRTYAGRVLGHVYLTNNTALATIAARTPSSNTPDLNSVPISQPTRRVSQPVAKPIPIPLPAQPTSSRSLPVPPSLPVVAPNPNATLPPPPPPTVTPIPNQPARTTPVSDQSSMAPPPHGRFFPLLNREAYFIVIPTNSTNLPRLVNQLQTLGISDGNIMPRQTPRGLHIAVGPFSDRGLAERWNHYFHQYKLDSRVYFGR